MKSMTELAGGELCLSSLKSHVVLLQTSHSWANAGVLLGVRMHRERGSFRNCRSDPTTKWERLEEEEG